MYARIVAVGRGSAVSGTSVRLAGGPSDEAADRLLMLMLIYDVPAVFVMG